MDVFVDVVRPLLLMPVGMANVARMVMRERTLHTYKLSHRHTGHVQCYDQYFREQLTTGRAIQRQA